MDNVLQYKQIAEQSKSILNTARRMNLYISLFEPGPRKKLDSMRVQKDIALLESYVTILKDALTDSDTPLFLT